MDFLISADTAYIFGTTQVQQLSIYEGRIGGQKPWNVVSCGSKKRKRHQIAQSVLLFCNNFQKTCPGPATSRHAFCMQEWLCHACNTFFIVCVCVSSFFLHQFPSHIYILNFVMCVHGGINIYTYVTYHKTSLKSQMSISPRDTNTDGVCLCDFLLFFFFFFVCKIMFIRP